MDEWRFVLLQLCDSGFPSGAFSHSFGFETYVQEGRIRDRGTFRAWLEAYLLRLWVYNDGLALRLAYEALEGGAEAAGDAPADGVPEAPAAPDSRDPGALATIWKLDRRMAAQTVPFESRSGAIRMGRRMLELARKLWPEAKVLAEYGAHIEAGRCCGQTALVFALACRGCGAPLREALLHLAYACSVSLVQNGVRAIPLGQTDGQQLLAGLRPVWTAAADKVAGLHRDDFGISPPGLELAAIRHERLDGRMFMS